MFILRDIYCGRFWGGLHGYKLCLQVFRPAAFGLAVVNMSTVVTQENVEQPKHKVEMLTQ